MSESSFKPSDDGVVINKIEAIPVLRLVPHSVLFHIIISDFSKEYSNFFGFSANSTVLHKFRHDFSCIHVTLNYRFTNLLEIHAKIVSL
jgi:hypothetical protein